MITPGNIYDKGNDRWKVEIHVCGIRLDIPGISHSEKEAEERQKEVIASLQNSEIGFAEFIHELDLNCTINGDWSDLRDGTGWSNDDIFKTILRAHELAR